VAEAATARAPDGTSGARADTSGRRADGYGRRDVRADGYGTRDVRADGYGTRDVRAGANRTRTDAAGSAAELVDACRAGDQAAWERLIQRYRAVVWTVARSHGLRPADCEDVCQLTWLRVIENIGSLTTPARLGAWIVTTARREALKVSGNGVKYHLVDDLSDFTPHACHQATPEETVLSRAEGDLARKAVRHLPAQHQALLGLLLRDPPMSYDAISAALAMPRGSIGPTRKRILRQARAFLRDM
jgi:RNA polymerase sigma factor (sigma-70 family)